MRRMPQTQSDIETFVSKICSFLSPSSKKLRPGGPIFWLRLSLRWMGVFFMKLGGSIGQARIHSKVLSEPDTPLMGSLSITL